ncbi:restriction endonuclease subunit S [Streptococcus sp. 121]|uniref:restriction endonuclease subunit S n=1 Tax=Streptococcus sp. 121 TaxID=2797637 RepID=UPI002D7F8307|nr:restriction endonuclease subunit S [Streptococcus sp. 121]
MINSGGIIIGGDLNIVQPNKDIILPEFLALQLTYSYIQKELSKRAQGKTVVHLHNSDLKEILIFIPKLEEQHCFVKQFLLLDHLITLQQCKPLVFISLALKAIS